MPRQLLEQKDFTFVGGINTEAGYLTFPPNTWLDGDNFEPKIDGSVSRRVKIDLETSFQDVFSFSNTSKENNAYGSFLWNNAGSLGTVTFVVTLADSTLHFFDTVSASLSPNVKAFTVDLSDYRVGSSPNVFGTSPIDVAVGNGKLIVVSADTEPLLITYDPVADSISVTTIVLYIRDFAGLDDGLDVDENPTTLSNEHHYNLLNQGWDTTKINDYESAAGAYPDNTQIWTIAKDTTDDFDPALLDKQDFGTTEAPKGRFILNVFNRDRATVSGVLGVATEVENYRPTATAFYAGRAWYAGFKSSTLGSLILFSQIVQNDDHYGHCYQEGDPTSEYNSDLVETDGGYILIPEAGGIKKILPLQQSLIVFADNGIWQISGGTTGFVATSYQVSKISSFGCISQFSVVEVENAAMYWSPAGIFALKYDGAAFTFVAQAISIDKIQTLYSSIPNFGKKYSSGFYNDETKKVYWLYQEEDSETLVDRFKKTKMLILDMRLNCFYPFTIADDAAYPIIVGGILTTNQGEQDLSFDVVVDGDDVVTGATEVIASLPIPAGTARINKFMTLVPDGTEWYLTFSDFLATEDTPDKFHDWYRFDDEGIEPDTLPYIITGYKIADDGMHQFQTPYIIVYMKKTEDGFSEVAGDIVADNQSSVLMQAMWDWTNNANANRWTTAREIYRHKRLYTPEDENDTFEDGYPLVLTKNKVRGKGRALSIKYSCSSGKDAQIAGWAIQYVKNTNV